MTFDLGQIAVFAIQKIKPNSEFAIGNTYESLTWYDKIQSKPTKQEFNEALTAWNAEYDAQEYARNRALAYLSVGDQLDQLMKDMRDGTTTHQTACESVKDKFPKP